MQRMALVWQGFDRSSGSGEQILVAGRLFDGFDLGAGLLGALPGLLGDGFLDHLEVGQSVHLDGLDHHSKPRSAIDSASPGATMTWSSTRTSIKARVVFRVCVSISSAREGCTVPLGWLCASTTAAAP